MEFDIQINQIVPSMGYRTLYIEANQKHGRGYQVHIVIDGIVDSTMADEPFSLYDALGGAQFTLEAVNKERGTNYLLPDVLLVSREAAMAERQTDFLSAKLLRENSSNIRVGRLSRR